MRLIPKNTKVRTTFYRGITAADLVIGFVGLLLITLTAASNLTFKWILATGLVLLLIPLFVTVDGGRLYVQIFFFFRYVVSRKVYRQGTLDESDIEGVIGYETVLENCFKNKSGEYWGAISVLPVDFRMLSYAAQTDLMDRTLGSILNQNANSRIDLIKLERPLVVDEFLQDELDRLKVLAERRENGELSEEEYVSRADLIQERIELLDIINSQEQVFYSHYYLIGYGESISEVQELLDRIFFTLQSGGLKAKKLEGWELTVLVRYSFDTAFDERTIFDQPKRVLEENLRPESVRFGLSSTVQNGHTLTHFVLTGYPIEVGAGWGEGLFDLPETRVTMKCVPVARERALKQIDRAILELAARSERGRMSEQMEREAHIESLQELLSAIQSANETYYDTTVILTVYDRKGQSANRKQVRRRLKEMGFGWSECVGRQQDAYLAAQFGTLDRLNMSRGIPSGSLAACFPFVSSAILERKGLLVGESKLPVFLDFFRRDEQRLNSNMIILGKIGSGKSYALKTLLTAFTGEDSKIFYLDPEGEGKNLAVHFGGTVLNVANGKAGKINPFQIIDRIGEEEDTTAFYAHLQFLEQFFRVILPGIDADSLELLNRLIRDVYLEKGIGERTEFQMLTPEQYPTFDDLYGKIFRCMEGEEDEYIRGCLKVLYNHMDKFRTGGRNSELWNGPTTLTLKENFVTFDFQQLFRSKNQVTANAQMLLVLKWIESEVMANREFNLKHKRNRKIVIAIDEAYLYIDEQYPAALDQIYQFAKRICKYNGMLIVTTQNVKDFVGTPDIARKSMAIINLCQYSLIFNLSPNDITDLCKLYENAGGLTQHECDTIVRNRRGRAFLISGEQRSLIDVVSIGETDNYF